MRIAVTGSTKLAGTIIKRFNADSYRVEDNIDFSKYDVFINNAHVGFSQATLLQKWFDVCRYDKSKTIINISSRAALPNLSKGYSYGAQKAALDHLADNLTYNSDKLCKIITINLGMLEDELPSDNITLYSEPWCHGTVDNLYDKNLFAAARKEIERCWHVFPRNVNSYSNDAEDLLTISLDPSRQVLLPKTTECVLDFKNNHFKQLLKRVDSFFNIKRNFNKNALNALFCTSYNISLNYPHNIHYETRTKYFSIVTYMSPDNDTGTFLYKTKDSPAVKVIEWKPNTSLFFYGYDNLTWHSFTAGSTPRITLNHFIEYENA